MTLREVLYLHERAIAQAGGADGIRDLGALESAIAQPRATFGGKDLYPNLHDKASALAFCLIQNHPFVDGNKRTGHAAMETFLELNDCSISASVDEQEAIILSVASGELNRESLARWIEGHSRARNER